MTIPGQIRDLLIITVLPIVGKYIDIYFILQIFFPDWFGFFWK